MIQYESGNSLKGEYSVSNKKKKSPTTLSTFAEAIRQEHNLNLKEAESIVRTFLSVMENSFKEDRDVILTRIGTFRVIHQEERVSVIPKSSQRILLSERKLLKFDSSKVISDELNKDNPKSYIEITEKEARELSKKHKQKKDQSL